MEKEPGTQLLRRRNPSPSQYEVQVRWERVRQVLEVSATGIRFDFNSPLKVGGRYPVSLSAPGLSMSQTLEITRCELIIDPTIGRFFRVTGQFFPNVA